MWLLNCNGRCAGPGHTQYKFHCLALLLLCNFERQPPPRKLPRLVWDLACSGRPTRDPGRLQRPGSPPHFCTNPCPGRHGPPTRTLAPPAPALSLRAFPLSCLKCLDQYLVGRGLLIIPWLPTLPSVLVDSNSDSNSAFPFSTVFASLTINSSLSSSPPHSSCWAFPFF